jgi:hypothetical protein
MSKRPPLVSQHLENISREALEKNQKVKGVLNLEFSNLSKLLTL